MTKPASADSGSSIGIRRNIEDDIVRTSGIAGHPTHSREVIQSEIFPNPPGNVMVRAGSISAYPDAANDFLPRAVQREPSTENVHPTNLISNHRILDRTVV